MWKPHFHRVTSRERVFCCAGAAAGEGAGAAPPILRESRGEGAAPRPALVLRQSDPRVRRQPHQQRGPRRRQISVSPRVEFECRSVAQCSHRFLLKVSKRWIYPPPPTPTPSLEKCEAPPFESACHPGCLSYLFPSGSRRVATRIRCLCRAQFSTDGTGFISSGGCVVRCTLDQVNNYCGVFSYANPASDIDPLT